MKLLFERLDETCGAFDPRRAVANCVQRLVSSRVVQAPAASSADELAGNDGVAGDFDVLTCGVPSVVDVGSGDRIAVERYGARVCALIAHYEPRLRAPRVSLEGPTMVAPLRVVVTGMLETSRGEEAMRFLIERRPDLPAGSGEE